jgi:hypothetical protein
VLCSSAASQPYHARASPCEDMEYMVAITESANLLLNTDKRRANGQGYRPPSTVIDARCSSSSLHATLKDHQLRLLCFPPVSKLHTLKRTIVVPVLSLAQVQGDLQCCHQSDLSVHLTCTCALLEATFWYLHMFIFPVRRSDQLPSLGHTTGTRHTLDGRSLRLFHTQGNRELSTSKQHAM